MPKITGVSNIVTPILTDLIPYGVTEDKIDAMNADASAFGTYASVPRNQIIQRAGATTQLDEQVKGAHDFVRTTMDTLSRNFKSTNYDF